MKSAHYKKIGLFLILLPIIAATGTKLYVNVHGRPGSVLGITAQNANVSIDFTNKKFDASPMVFGGVHAPDPADLSIWTGLTNIGVSLVRSDFFIEFCGPKNITLQDYKNNVNNIQDTRNWTATCLSNVSQIYSLAKKRNMKVVAVVAYTPPWLTKSGVPQDLPVDWEVYEDLVTKMYKLNRQYIDYIEIWNEPDHKNFLKSEGDHKEEDYLLLYEHVSKAIRTVDDQMNDGKRVKIGGPAISCACHMSFIEKLLQKPENRNYIDFISYHSYGGGDIYISQIRDLMKKYGYEGTPLFISEWNKTSLANEEREYTLTYQAVNYTASRLINFLNNGVEMAAYFSLRKNDPTSSLPERQAYGFYKLELDKLKLLPQQVSWLYLSKKLELGQGGGQIFQSSVDIPNISVLGYKNKSNVKGLFISNASSSSTINFTGNTIVEKDQAVIIELSSVTEKGTQTGYCIQKYTPTTDVTKFKFDIPASSLVSVTFSNSTGSLTETAKLLSPTTQNNCLVFSN